MPFSAYMSFEAVVEVRNAMTAAVEEVFLKGDCRPEWGRLMAYYVELVFLSLINPPSHYHLHLPCTCLAFTSDTGTSLLRTHYECPFVPCGGDTIYIVA